MTYNNECNGTEEGAGTGGGTGEDAVPLQRGLESMNSWGSMPAMGLPVILRTLSIPAHPTDELSVVRTYELGFSIMSTNSTF